VTCIQPQLWVERPSAAIEFYAAAFAATVVHQVGDEDDIVAQLAVGDAHFRGANADPDAGRFNPAALRGGTSRTLLVLEDPDAAVRDACAAGATLTSPVGDEHGWRIGRITDPFGHQWEIGKPLVAGPPRQSLSR
jgi:PhnB protein